MDLQMYNVLEFIHENLADFQVRQLVVPATRLYKKNKQSLFFLCLKLLTVMQGIFIFQHTIFSSIVIR